MKHMWAPLVTEIKQYNASSAVMQLKQAMDYLGLSHVIVDHSLWPVSQRWASQSSPVRQWEQPPSSAVDPLAGDTAPVQSPAALKADGEVKGGGGIIHKYYLPLPLRVQKNIPSVPEITVTHGWMGEIKLHHFLVPTHLRVFAISSIQFLLILFGLLLHGQVCPLQLLLEGSLKNQQNNRNM